MVICGMLNSNLPRATRGRIAPVSNTTVQMTTIIPFARASRLLESGKYFTLRGRYIVQGEPLPEIGDEFSIAFTVDKEGFASIEGKQVKHLSRVNGTNSVFVVAGPPTAGEVLAAALKALGELESYRQRIYCDDQDERFLVRVGAASRASCDS
jgi:hypothetical protein